MGVFYLIKIKDLYYYGKKLSFSKKMIYNWTLLFIKNMDLKEMVE